MTCHPPPEHFQGKQIPDHLKDARAKGALVSAEVHGTELPGHMAAGFSCVIETCALFVILWAATFALFPDHPNLFPFFLCIGLGWMVWKAGRSSLNGWGKLERLHQVIEEERWEIEHHRAQEKEELRAMYAAKGFAGKLLDEVVEVLMADDNRLLRVMLEEELGLSLEVYQHPLKQGAGALCASLIVTPLLLASLALWPSFGLPLCGALLFAIATWISARREKRAPMQSMVWNLALLTFGAAATYFLAGTLR